MKDIISQSLGIDEIISPSIPKHLTLVKNNESDYEDARGTIKQRMTDLDEAILECKSLAYQAQHPNWYQTLNMLLKTSVEASRELLALQRQDIEIQKLTKQPSNPNNVTNNLFVGTTRDLLAIIQKAQK